MRDNIDSSTVSECVGKTTRRGENVFAFGQRGTLGFLRYFGPKYQGKPKKHQRAISRKTCTELRNLFEVGQRGTLGFLRYFWAEVPGKT